LRASCGMNFAVPCTSPTRFTFHNTIIVDRIPTTIRANDHLIERRVAQHQLHHRRHPQRLAQQSDRHRVP
jgi:hypothetical protein